MKNCLITSNMAAAAAVALIFVCFMIGNVASLKCYECNSGDSPQCSENLFIGFANQVKEDCTCCTKTVDNGATSRKCASGLASVSCIPLPSHYVCTTDKCNTGIRDSSPFGIVLLLSVAAAVVAVRRHLA